MGSAEAPELPIVDCRLKLTDQSKFGIPTLSCPPARQLTGQSKFGIPTLSIVNRKSSIVDCRLKRWCGNFLRYPPVRQLTDQSKSGNSDALNRQSSIENRQSSIAD
jgi:hypothetical protein